MFILGHDFGHYSLDALHHQLHLQYSTSHDLSPHVPITHYFDAPAALHHPFNYH